MSVRERAIFSFTFNASKDWLAASRFCILLILLF